MMIFFSDKRVRINRKINLQIVGKKCTLLRDLQDCGSVFSTCFPLIITIIYLYLFGRYSSKSFLGSRPFGFRDILASKGRNFTIFVTSRPVGHLNDSPGIDIKDKNVFCVKTRDSKRIRKCLVPT